MLNNWDSGLHRPSVFNMVTFDMRRCNHLDKDRRRGDYG
jgi:hypothetical protein